MCDHTAPYLEAEVGNLTPLPLLSDPGSVILSGVMMMNT